MSALPNGLSLQGRHRCRLCGATWCCAQGPCAPPAPVNETLVCLRCDAARAENDLGRCEVDLEQARRKKLLVEQAKERLALARARHERLSAAMADVYGGFTA